MGYFESIHESFSGPGFEDDIYFMIVNGLSDDIGTAVETAQTINLNFNFLNSGIDSLLRLSRDTGLIEEVSLVSDGGSLYHLDLTIDGGTGDLFKFNNGASFLGATVGNANFAPLSVLDNVDGDFNASELVDVQDLNLVLFNWNEEGVNLPNEWSHQRPDDNIRVGVAELNLVLFNWNEMATSAATVPEPSTVMLMLVAVSIVLCRRKRNDG